MIRFHMLNIYQCSPRCGDWYGCIWHVVAPTRGKAHTLFMAWMDDWFDGLDFTDPVSIKLLEKGVDLPEGVDADWRWAKANGTYIPPESIQEEFGY